MAGDGWTYQAPPKPPDDGWTYQAPPAAPTMPAEPPPAQDDGWTYQAPASSQQPLTPPAESPSEASAPPLAELMTQADQTALAGSVAPTTPAQPTPTDPSTPALSDLFSQASQADTAQAVPSQAAPTGPPDDRPGFFSSLWEGSQQANREGLRLGDAAFNPYNLTPQAAPPLVDRTLMGGVGYGIGHAFPTLATTAAGAGIGAAAGAVEGGVGAVPGALAGGMAAAGSMSFVQSLVPAYDAAIARGVPHEQAVTEALNQSALRGTISTMATWAPGVFKPFESWVGNLLFQATAMQPAIGAGGRIGERLLAGQPMPSAEELGQGYVQDALTGTLLAAPHAIPSILRGFGAMPETAPRPSGLIEGPETQPALPAPGESTPAAVPTVPGEQPTPPAPSPITPVPPAPAPAPTTPATTEPSVPATLEDKITLTERSNIDQTGLEHIGQLVEQNFADRDLLTQVKDRLAGGETWQDISRSLGDNAALTPYALRGLAAVNPPVVGPTAGAPGVGAGTGAGQTGGGTAGPGTGGPLPDDKSQTGPGSTQPAPGPTPPDSTPTTPGVVQPDVSGGGGGGRLAGGSPTGDSGTGTQGADGTTTPPSGGAQTPADTGTTGTVAGPVPAPPAAGGGTAQGVVASPGGTQRVQSVNGLSADTKYEVVPASSLVMARDDLQPRDRGERAALEGQVAHIAAKLDPSQLVGSPVSDFGAPVVGPDHIVESGNGRLASILRAEQLHPEKHAAYVQALNDHGFNTTGIQSPVLIRRRTSEPVHPDGQPATRAQWAQDSNAPRGAVMSPTEQARTDAGRLSPAILDKYTPNQTDGLLSPGNRNFVRDWVDTLPVNERNAVMDASGNLSAPGLMRLQGALLARAYDDKGTLARSLESTDDNTKAITGAMVDAAPGWARLRHEISEGRVPKSLDITPDLLRAAEMVRQARKRGVKPGDAIREDDVLNPISPMVRNIFKAFYNDNLTRAAGRARVAAVLHKYAEEAAKQSTGTNLFGDKPLTPEQIWATARNVAAPTPDLFGTGDAAPSAPSAAPAGETIGASRRLGDISYRNIRLDDEEPAPSEPTTMAEDTLANRAPSERETQSRLGQDELPLEDYAAEPGDAGDTAETAEARRRGGTIRRPKSPRAPGAPKRFEDYQYADREVRLYNIFKDAGEDPSRAVNAPIKRQIEIMAAQIKKTFNFSDVTVQAKADPVATRDAMADFYYGAQNMTNVLFGPYDMISMSGRMSLVFRNARFSSLGSYTGAMEVNLQDTARSFAHEWTHGLDHYLNGLINNHPGKKWLLSKSAREALLNTPNSLTVNQLDRVLASFLNALDALTYDQAALAVRQLDLTRRSQQRDIFGNLTTAAKAAQAEADALQQGVADVNLPPSRFQQDASAVATAQNDPYWARIEELLARAHEAYIAQRVATANLDPRGIAMPDEAYTSEIPSLKQLYPEPGDRVTIFQVFDDLHQAINAAGLFGTGVPGAAAVDFGHIDPRTWKARGITGETALQRAFRGVAESYRNFRPAWKETALFDPLAPSSGRTRWEGAKNFGRQWTYSLNANLDAMTHYYDKGGKPQVAALIREIKGKLSPEPVKGTVVPETYEEEVNARSRRNITLLNLALDKNGLTKMTGFEARMLRHALITEDKTFPEDWTQRNQPNLRVIPANINQASADIRRLLTDEYKNNEEAKIDIGFAKTSYFPIVYNDAKIGADRAGFTRDAKTLHEFIFDQDVGLPGDPEMPMNLWERWMKLSKPERNNADPTLDNHMKEMARIFRRLKRIQKDIDAGALDPLVAQPEIDQLTQDLGDQADQAHPLLRDMIGQLMADNWLSAIVGADPFAFDTRGPGAKYLKRRELPPESQFIMQDWLQTDPRAVLPAYFHQSARRTAYAKRFSPDSEELKRIIKAITDRGGLKEDADLVQNIVELVTGKQRTGTHTRAIINGMNIAHAVGSVGLMARTLWASIAEPTTALLTTRSTRYMLDIFSNQFGDIFGSAAAAERTEMATQLGIISDELYSSALTSRTDGDYAETPRIGKFMTDYYRLNGLTWITNAQRVAAMGGGTRLIQRWAQQTQLGKPSPAAAGSNQPQAPMRKLSNRQQDKQDDAKRWLNKLGIADEHFPAFAAWITQFNGLPPIERVLDDDMGSLFAPAIRRLVGWTIQEPTRMQMPIKARDPVIRFMFSLMSFSYAFVQNVLEPGMHEFAHVAKRRYTRVLDERMSSKAAKAATAGGTGGGAAPPPTGGTPAGGTGPQPGAGGGGGGSAPKPSWFDKALAAGAASGATAELVVKMLAAAFTMFVGQFITTTAREFIFNHEEFRKHQEEGDLGGWLSARAMSRTGLGGTLDPVVNVITSLRYGASLDNLVMGAFPATTLRELKDILFPSVDPTEGGAQTNTSLWRQSRAVYQLLGIPLMSYLLTRLSGAMGVTGAIMKTTQAAVSFGLQYGTSLDAANRFANFWSGQKGTELGSTGEGSGLESLGGGMESLKDMDTIGSGPGASGESGIGTIAAGLLDDLIVPAAKVAQHLGGIMPTWLKTIAAAATGFGVGYAWWNGNEAGREASP